jgi:hypothetical protein
MQESLPNPSNAYVPFSFFYSLHSKGHAPIGWMESYLAAVLPGCGNHRSRLSMPALWWMEFKDQNAATAWTLTIQAVPAMHCIAIG